MTVAPHRFDDSRARTWRKTEEVLAFRTADAVTLHKAWGDLALRPEGWLIVPLTADGRPTDALHGVDPDAFAQTYAPSESGRPHTWRKIATVRAYQPGEPFRVHTKVGDHVEGDGSTGSATAWLVRNPGGELYPVEDDVFRRTYTQVDAPHPRPLRRRTLDEHLRADGRPKRILALDGGGMRGVLTVAFLQRLEAMLRERHGDPDLRLADWFDLIAGTSTGAILAAGLAVGRSMDELATLYTTLPKVIFGRRRFFPALRARYAHEALEQILLEQFGDVTLGSPQIRTGLLVVTKRLDTGSIWPLTNFPTGPYFRQPADSPYIGNEHYLLRSVVRASTAAPYYFEPKTIPITATSDGRRTEGAFVDGGVSPHNNPALQALLAATLHGPGLRWPMGADRLLVVSVGTGNASHAQSRARSTLMHTLQSLLSVMSDTGDLVETQLQWMSKSHTARAIDGEVGDLASDQLGDHPLLTYVRYNVHDDVAWERASLGRTLTPEERAALGPMDAPENVPILDALGREAAAKLVLDAHLPRQFDPDPA